MQMQLEDIGLTSGYQHRVTKISASASATDFIVLLGANGAGKSSLLDIISAVVTPTTGQIRATNRIGYCPQTPEVGLFGQSAVHEVAFSLRDTVRHVRAAWPNIERKLSTYGLPGIAPDANPMTWSTGLQRRFMTALTLMQRPDVLLLDEPSAGLDGESKRILLEQLEFIRGHCMVIVATHDLDAMHPLATRAWVLDQGHLSFDGTPQTLFQQPHILSDAGVSFSPSLSLQDLCLQAGLISDCRLESAEALVARLSAGRESNTESESGVNEDVHAIQRNHCESAKQGVGDGKAAEKPRGKFVQQADATPATRKPARTLAGRSIDPRAILFSSSVVTIATTIVHTATGGVAAVVATVALMLWTRPKWLTILHWTLAWFMFAALATAISGTQIHFLKHPFVVNFNLRLAEQALTAVIPYWCYLQLGQLFTSRMTALELQAMIDWLLRILRLPSSTRHLISVCAGMVFRFIPAIATMYVTQVRAVYIRSLTSPTVPTENRTHRQHRQRERTQKRQNSVNMRFLSRIVAPLMIRLIAFGEMTAEALTARRIFDNPPQYFPFTKTMNRQSWLGVIVSIIGAIWIVLMAS